MSGQSLNKGKPRKQKENLRFLFPRVQKKGRSIAEHRASLPYQKYADMNFAAVQKSH